MNCTKCRHLLDTGFKCWNCGTQYELVKKKGTAEFINYPIDRTPTTADFYYPEDGYIQV